MQANFDFYGKILTGAQELRPRWKRCVSMVDGQLGDALGQIYVDRTFGVEGKQRMLTMVHLIETMMGQDLDSLDWMTPATKKQALEKLHAVANKIGYPDKWRDYSKVKVVRGDALGDSDRLSQFESHRQIVKIGKPVDRSEWQMTPPTVNAYYEPTTNDINFPAGILQPPFYDNKMDDGVNFGAIGAVIGHELTHAFDDEGRHFDEKGNLRDWWTPKDAEQFEQRAQCLVDQYSSYTAVDDIKLNGKLTLGENTADNGGLRLAYMALMGRLAERTKAGDPPTKIDGFTEQQRLFLGFEADLVHEPYGRIGKDACRDRPALTGEGPRHRGSVEHAGIPHRFRVYGGPANGPSKGMPRLVRRGIELGLRSLALLVLCLPCRSQDNYEIQVYGAETVVRPAPPWSSCTITSPWRGRKASLMACVPPITPGMKPLRSRTVSTNGSKSDSIFSPAPMSRTVGIGSAITFGRAFESHLRGSGRSA